MFLELVFIIKRLVTLALTGACSYYAIFRPVAAMKFL